MPLIFDHCPVCSANTRYHILRHTDSVLEMACEDCATVLITEEGVLIGQRPATGEERASIPERYQPSEEELAQWREDMREGIRDVQAWIKEGCPGAGTAFMQDLPRFLEVFDKMRANFPESD